MEYLDFELEIEQLGKQEYRVVARSRSGETRATMRFPLDEAALKDLLKDVQIALLSSSGQRRPALSSAEQTVHDFGQQMFEALVAGEVRTSYDLSLRAAEEQGQGLRLKLSLLAPELAVLPWEYLFDPRQGQYLSLSLQTPLVRTLALARPIQPLKVAPPLRILVMIASPDGLGLEPLDTRKERLRIEEALKGVQARGLAQLTWLEGQTWRDLNRAMRGGPWHIFHFIGHGGYDRQSEQGVLALANEEGQAHLLSAAQMALLLESHKSLRLVLLNACEGAQGSQHDLFASTAATLARQGIPAVLAMQYPITDTAAIECTRAFYEALADGLPVDEAATEARRAIHLERQHSLEWGTPVLYMRASDGLLFDLTQKPAAAKTEPAASPAPRGGAAATPPPKEAAAPYRSLEATEKSAERAAPVNLPRAWLMVDGQQFLLQQTDTTIGRAPTNDLVIASDTQASGRHALIHFDGTRFILQDLGSTNGTFLKEARLSSPTPLGSGDQIRVGQHTLTFLTQTPPSPAAPAGVPPTERAAVPPTERAAAPPAPRVPSSVPAHMAALQVVRQSAWGSSLVAFHILLDGQRIGTVANGKSQLLEIQPGHHLLAFHIPFSVSSSPLGFDVAPGETVTFHCQYSVRGGLNGSIQVWKL